ncbi:unnamed protein product [Parnassius mnemosyne]|uniref:Aquaporin 14 n=1 Tax=Parnassius mnemosyne TaxID=213953 RepID=A0AAV1KST9_9NEOP
MCTGVALAILEKAEVISPLVDARGVPTTAGTVSAGYQNFLICIEMLAAAVALRYAFPAAVYAHARRDPHRSVTMQSISSSLKVSHHHHAAHHKNNGGVMIR